MKNVSAKLTITTRDYLTKYLGEDYTLTKPLSHKGMKNFMLEKNIPIPRSENIANISIEDVLTGRYVLVRSECNKKHKKAQIIAYKNPRSDLSNCLENHSAEEMLARRAEILAKENLEYDAWGLVVEKIDERIFQYDDLTITEKSSRTETYTKSFHKGRKRER